MTPNERAKRIIEAWDHNQDSYLEEFIATAIREAEERKQTEVDALREVGRRALEMIDAVDDWTAEAQAEIIEPLRALCAPRPILSPRSQSVDG